MASSVEVAPDSWPSGRTAAEVHGDWLVRARVAADLPPARPRQSVLIAGIVCGSVEPALAERLVHAGLPTRRCSDGWAIVAPAAGSLAAIAAWLRSVGLAGPWRDELLDVVAVNGRVLATVERAAVRMFGFATVAVHLIGVAGDGRIWAQLRALDKATDPGLWDTLMGGQVAAGESTSETLERETMEEAGLEMTDLCELAACEPIRIRRPVADGYMVERIDVFRARVREGAVPLNRDGEVARFECLDDAALRQRLEAGAFTLEASLILGAELERGGRRGPA